MASTPSKLSLSSIQENNKLKLSPILREILAYLYLRIISPLVERRLYYAALSFYLEEYFPASFLASVVFFAFFEFFSVGLHFQA